MKYFSHSKVALAGTLHKTLPWGKNTSNSKVFSRHRLDNLFDNAIAKVNARQCSNNFGRIHEVASHVSFTGTNTYVYFRRIFLEHSNIKHDFIRCSEYPSLNREYYALAICRTFPTLFSLQPICKTSFSIYHINYHCTIDYPNSRTAARLIRIFNSSLSQNTASHSKSHINVIRM